MGTTYAEYRDQYVTFVAGYAKYTFPVVRMGLGTVILLAGGHKLVAPEVWTKYAAPWVITLWPEGLLSFERVMVLNGVVEILFGLAILADVYTAITAGIVALSLFAVVFDLLTGAITTGTHVDVLIRDIGLLALATGTTLLAATRETE